MGETSVVYILFLIFCGAAILATLALSLRQSLIPDRMMGRTTSIFRAGTWGLMPIGAILGGLLAEYIALPVPYIVFGGLMVLTAFYVWLELGAADVDSARRRAAAVGEESDE